MNILKIILALWLAGSLFSPLVTGVSDGNPVLYDKYKGLEEFGVLDAWKMGYTGKDVKIAIIDSGIDFATPDLIGTQARLSDKSSPYDGWPIVIDLDSLSSYQRGIFGVRSQYANTTSTNVDDYRVTGTSKSGRYHIGDHPDQHLFAFYGQPVKVLVVDENTPGIYDTVYVDLNNNRDFRDDKACKKGDEISYWDRDDDGYPDESGGMIYFISDGITPPPLARMLFGQDAKVPGSGELVAFHFDPYSHGTMCASTVAAQGRNVKGVAPDARIISVRALGSNDILFCLLASLGYDGEPNTGDEANVISRSGSIPTAEKGADETSVFLEYLTQVISPNTTLVFGNGNDGSGYGTCGAPCSEHVINVGAISDLWWNGSSYRSDVTCFSSRGPNALGQIKPNILATGYWAPTAEPLWKTHNGRASWSNKCGGTSGATPHASALVALIYQAYRDAHGVFPTSEKARDILMSSATNIDEEVFAQGSGLINAKRAVQIASKKDGVLVEPALLVTPPVRAGSRLDFNFTITNYSGEDITLKPQKLMKKAKREFILEPEKMSLLEIPDEMLSCDLLKASFYYSRIDRNTKVCLADWELCEGYDLILYNWKDINGDRWFKSDRGLYEDTQESELETIAIGDWGSVFTSEVRVNNPANRISDGIVAYLKRKNATQNDEVHLMVETYSWVPWDIEISIDNNRTHCLIPVPDATGIYQGRILLKHSGEEQCIPVSFAAYRKDEILIGDGRDIYENNKIYGRFEGDGKGFYDSRFYPILYSGQDLVTINVTWDDQYTDIDVYLYGETTKNFSSIWDFPTSPPVELPELTVLTDNGHSTRIWRTKIDQHVSGSGLGASYSTFYTSTGKNKEVITGELTDGLNIVVLNQVISGGNTYGENLTIQTEVSSFAQPQIIITKAGEVVSLLPAGADSVAGFSLKEDIAEGTLKIFEAEIGDVILLRSNSTEYYPHLFFDKNANGLFDGDIDEAVFAESRNDIVAPSHEDTIMISDNGTYILIDFVGEFYHMKDLYRICDDAPIEIKAPEKAGRYYGILEKNGKHLPVLQEMVVEPGEPVSISVYSLDRIGCNVSFDVSLKIFDSFGNLASGDTEAIVEFNEISQRVKVIKGIGSIRLTAPGETGQYMIRCKGQYGSAEKAIEITDEAIIEIVDIDLSDQDISFKIINIGGSELDLNIYANPSKHLDFNPDAQPMAPVKMYQSMFSYSKILLRAINTSMNMSGGQEREIVFPRTLSHEEPYIVVIANTAGDVIDHKEINSPDPLPVKDGGIEELKDNETAIVNQPLSFKAEGLVSVQMNDHQPLFFITHGAFSFYPDETGQLKVDMDERDYEIEVVAENPKAPAKITRALEIKPPSKVQSISINATNGNISLVWPPVVRADRYHVYQLERDILKQVGEVEDPRYSMDGELWSSYTFRISAVTETGIEGQLSDPVGSVVIPQ
ncbi:MAG: Pyrolysin precursor [Methanosaeta sp. PtaB.Bin039]|nr:MAG: Pyrolysin precursor [Methanosaeta sp. PtaB.Bin039]